MMKTKFYGFTPVLVLFCTLAISAQTSEKNKNKLLSEVTDFRRSLSGAIEKRDRKLLETFFAEDFTHTHAIGQVDGKAKRIDAILTGDKTLESVAPDEIAIRFYGKQTAVAVGQTTIDAVVYRWTILYVKNGKKWQIAASQASKKA